MFIIHDSYKKLKVRKKCFLIFLAIWKHFRNRDDVSSPKVLTQCKALKIHYKCISAKYHDSLTCAESMPGIAYSLKKCIYIWTVNEFSIVKEVKVLRSDYLTCVIKVQNFSFEIIHLGLRFRIHNTGKCILIKEDRQWILQESAFPPPPRRFHSLVLYDFLMSIDSNLPIV